MAKILIVDDQKTIVAVVEQLLKNRGHDTTTASNSVEALELLIGRTIDLVIADIVMPGGVSGLELVQAIRSEERLKTIPVVLLTGKREKGDVEKGIRAGADDYMIKPVDPELLLAKVESLLAKPGSPTQFVELGVNESVNWDFSAQVVSMSELGVQMVSQVAPAVGSKIKLDSPIFVKAGLTSPWVNVISCEPIQTADHLFYFTVRGNFIGLTEAQLQPLRAFLSKERLKRST